MTVVPNRRLLQARSVRELMEKRTLTKIGEGFYADSKGAVYFDINEFMAFHKLPDEAEARAAVWEEVKKQFGADVIKLLED